MPDIFTLPVPSPRQVRAIRAWLGINHREAAEKIGVASSTLHLYENGRRINEASLALLGLWVSKLAVKIRKDGSLELPL